MAARGDPEIAIGFHRPLYGFHGALGGLGPAAVRGAERSASVLASSSTPLVQAAPLDQPGPKPAGQVTAVACLSRSNGTRIKLTEFAKLGEINFTATAQ